MLKNILNQLFGLGYIPEGLSDWDVVGRIWMNKYNLDVWFNHWINLKRINSWFEYIFLFENMVSTCCWVVYFHIWLVVGVFWSKFFYLTLYESHYLTFPVTVIASSLSDLFILMGFFMSTCANWSFRSQTSMKLSLRWSKLHSTYYFYLSLKFLTVTSC